MTNKAKIGIGILALVIAFAFGRYTAPTSIKTSTQTAQTDDKTNTKTQETDVHKKTTTTTTDITKPDGTKSHTTTEIVDENTDKKSGQISSDLTKKTSFETKEVIKEKSKLSISALAGAKIGFASPSVELDYGAMVSRDLIGPITIGAFGFKSGLVGMSIGLSF